MQNQNTGFESQTLQAIDGILDSTMGATSGGTGGKPPTYAEGKRPLEPNPEEADERNAEFRVKKHLKERDEAIQLLQQKDQMLANLQGQLDQLTKFIKPESAQTADPTENMTSTEAALYGGIKQLEQQLQVLAQGLNGINTKVVKEEYEKKESGFYSNYGLEDEQSREEARDLIKGFAKGESEIAKRLVNGEIEIGRVYELALLKSGKPILGRQQDPSSIFGKGRQEATVPRSENRQGSNIDQARSVLRDRESTNKTKAVQVGISAIADDILESLMSQ